jgi:hypothetical protein
MKAAGEAGPGLQCLAALNHLLIAARHLPGAVDAAIGAVRHEGHQLDVFWPCLEIIKRRRRAHRVAECRMLGDIRDQLPVDIDGAAVLEGGDVFRTSLCDRHVWLRFGKLFAVIQ